MDVAQVQRWLLEHHGLRIEQDMGQYLLRQMQSPLAAAGSAPAKIAVIGGNARTGLPVRQIVDVQELISGLAS